MKKHSLFKFLAIILLLLVVVTYIIPNRSGIEGYLPLGDIFTNYIQSYYYFFDTAAFILAVGALYGVLTKTEMYKKLLNSIVKKLKSKSKLAIFACIVFLTVVSSVTGITTPLIVFVPFIISIILLLGYDKLVAISSTILPMLIGFIGGIGVNLRDASDYYSYSVITFDEMLGIKRGTSLIPQLVLLVLGIALLILFVNKHIKAIENKKVKYELNGTDEFIVPELKGSNKEVKAWPLIVVLAILFVLLMLGLIPWKSLYEIEVFHDFHEWLSKLNIRGFNVYLNLVSGMFPPFGAWLELGSYMMEIVVIILTIIVVKFICKIKFNDLIEYVSEGAKKMLPTAALVMLAYTILICTYNNGFIETLITNASKGGDINFVLASLFTMIGSVLHIDLYYTTAGIFTPIINVVTNEGMFKVYSLAFQSLYGLINIVGPTSIMLIFALSYLDVPYTTWLKYIWRFVLSLFIIIFATLMILTLI